MIDGRLSVSNNCYVGYSGTGTFTQNGGTNTMPLDHGNGFLFLNGSNGTYNLSGSGQLSANTEYIGYTSMGTFTQTGGTNTISSYLYIARFNNSSSTYTLSGGTLIDC